VHEVQAWWYLSSMAATGPASPTTFGAAVASDSRCRRIPMACGLYTNDRPEGAPKIGNFPRINHGAQAWSLPVGPE